MGLLDWFGKKQEKNPLQVKIDEWTGLIKTGRATLLKNADNLRALQRDVQSVTEDISVLTTRAKSAEKGEAKELIGRVIDKELALAKKQELLTSALGEQSKAEKAINNWQSDLKELENTAALHGVQVDLASYRQQASAFRSEVESYRSELNIKTEIAKGRADLDEVVDPNEKYLEVIKDQEIEKRLAELKGVKFNFEAEVDNKNFQAP